MVAVLALIGGFRGIVVAVVAAAVTLFAMEAYHRSFIHPSIAREARADYVRIAVLEAEKAKVAELQRQLTAGAVAIEEHRKRLAASESLHEAETERLEKEIAENEKALEAAGRACRLDSGDVDFILREPGVNPPR